VLCKQKGCISPSSANLQAKTSAQAFGICARISLCDESAILRGGSRGKQMAQRRNRGDSIERWEVGLVKAMLARGTWNDQGILSYFTRPTRTLNHRLIGQIRRGTRYPGVTASGSEELDKFLDSWPAIDPATGLSINGDELLIKAREAMIAAVRTFNGAGMRFRAELFIVAAIIAWTYLLHAFYKRERIDYRYKRQGRVVKTPEGADKYWDLDKCLD